MAHFPRFLCKKINLLTATENIFRSTTPILLPFYHVVSNVKLPHILNYPYRSSIQFEQELDILLKYFKPVSLEYIYENPGSTEKVFHLSFDDGLKECEEIIAPVLIKKGIPATFFINSGFVDNKELFHRYKASLILSELITNPCYQAEGFLEKNGLTRKNILQADFSQRGILEEATEMMNIDFHSFLTEHKPYLTTKQIQNLNKQGFSIGGHSHKHPELWKIAEKKQFKHIKKSMKWVTENINPKVKAFSFPFTDNKVSKDLIVKLKHENICDITFGTAGLKYDEIDFHFQRYPAEQPGDFKQNLKGEFIYYKLRKKIGKAKVKH